MHQNTLIKIMTLVSMTILSLLNADPVFDHLVWSDEFDSPGAGPVDSSKWFHQTQLPAGNSWYNGEIQHYTNRMINSYVYNGYMYLVAQKETFTDQGETKYYTSARLNSKYAFLYGRIEVRAKLPTGVGTWPAIWMLGKNINEDGAYWDNLGYDTTPWPECGEIDIMEHWGSNQNYVQSAIHTPSSYGGTVNIGGQVIPTASQEFHVYAMDWNSDRLEFSVDSIVHYTYQPMTKDASTWPFDREMYLLLNIAIQSSIDPSFNKSAMIVDYVRYYKESPVAISQKNTPSNPSFYPNPVNDHMNISFKASPGRNMTVSIYSIDGKLVKKYVRSTDYNFITLNGLNELAKGMYIVSFDLLNKNYRYKIVKH
jgi:beta-glucanase (GH16 family)